MGCAETASLGLKNHTGLHTKRLFCRLNARFSQAAVASSFISLFALKPRERASSFKRADSTACIDAIERVTSGAREAVVKALRLGKPQNTPAKTKGKP
jgi:hypothetical protein